jgi:hypothetical protein
MANDSDMSGSDGGNATSFNYTRRDAKNFYLRVMPLGASITQGYLSTDGNGYRQWIRKQLRWKGWEVNSEESLALTNINTQSLTTAAYSGWNATDRHHARQGESSLSKFSFPLLLSLYTHEAK